MTINCTPIKQLFFDPISEYRILACKPNKIDGSNIDKIQLNNYGNFTISGNNLTNYQLNQSILLEIEPKENAKYQSEYLCLGYGGIEIEEENGQVIITEKQEKAILRQFMTPSQADNVFEAYPTFVEMVLNGEADKIDVKKIYNVGNFRLNEYVEKIKSNCDMIFFNKNCWELGITKNDDVIKIRKKYPKVNVFIENFKRSPYETLCGVVEFGFDKADPVILKNFPFLKESKERCEYFCIEFLKTNELNGNTKLNPNIIARYVKVNLPELFPHVVDVVKNNGLIYYDEKTKYCSLASTRKKEEIIAEHIEYRVKKNKEFNYYDKKFIEQFRNIDGMALTDEQMKILELMDKGWIALLTGFPGSGKTQSTKALIRMLEVKRKSYTLLAPTGISSKVLKQSTGRNAYTIHLALANNLPLGEYIIVDEFSMVDVDLFSLLLKSMGKERKIVFVCDENQLPSIGAGNIAHDIIASGVVPVAKLTKIFRYNSSGIITNVTDVGRGNLNHIHSKYDDFIYVEAENDIEQQLLNQYDIYLDMGYKKDDILILTPFRVSSFGSNAINNIIQKHINKKPESEAKIRIDGVDICFKIGDRVLNTKNNYYMNKWDIESNDYEYDFTIDGNGNEEETICTMAVFNGDLGNVIDIRNSQEGIVQVIVAWDEGITCVEGIDIRNLLLGYCTSIHKSQGHSNKCVIVVVNKSGRKGFISKNLLYVALSRAQEQLAIIAKEDLIAESLEYQANLLRETWLEELLKEG